jgi:hypothetical protein
MINGIAVPGKVEEEVNGGFVPLSCMAASSSARGSSLRMEVRSNHLVHLDLERRAMYLRAVGAVMPRALSTMAM